MSDIENKKEKTEVLLEEVVPTLFIGLGGTGAEILWRIRRRILNTLWGAGSNVRIENLTEFPLAEFLHIDLDASTISEQGKAQKTDILAKKISFKEEERVVKTLDMSKYIKTDEDLEKYPLIQEWFPLSRSKINELNIPVEKGAGQIRAFSRLYFFDKYQEIKNAVRSKAEHLQANLSTASLASRLGLKVKTGSLKVVVVASTAGGTGSGCFLDLGYLSGILCEENTSLVLVLPTGYRGANRTRTQANTYSALMELETCMRQGSHFIHEWSESEIIRNWPGDPYKDIYLIDTANLANSQTEDIKDIYSMVADGLFEDFSTKDFANRKRSISVNQNQHKTNPYVARLSRSVYGDMKLTFSRGYSSFGQSIIDMHIEQKKNILLYRQVNDMLKVFFGVSSDDPKNNTPTDGERDELLANHMYLGFDNEIINYDFVVDDDSFKRGAERTTFPLVSELLRVNGVSRLGDIEKRISNRFDEIRTGGGFKEWPQKIAEAVASINHDTFRAIDSGSGLHEDVVRRRRHEVLSEFLDTQREKGLVKALWMRVDNKERGGLDYTIKLVHSIKDKLDNTQTGIVRMLKENAKWFSDLSEFLRSEEAERLQEHLNQAIGKMFSAQSQAEMKLKQISEAVKLYVRFHLIAIASREAAVLVEELSERLAKQQGTDEDGNPVWTGFVGELDEGRILVKNIVFDLEKQISLTREAMRQAHSMYFVLSGSDGSIDKSELVSRKQAQQWADEAFKDFGGTQQLFAMLRDDEGRAELIGKLQNRALELISVENDQEEENPLFAALDAHQNPGQLFSDFLQRAMPWVSARLDRYLKEHDPNDQYKCYIGVKDSMRFESKYGALLKSRLPTGTMITSKEVGFVEIDTPGKIVCYTELSGLPLPSLKGLDEWYTSYREENGKTPVHTHRRTSTFVHPRELTTDELAARAEDFRLFVQAVALGVLERAQKGDENGLYKLWIKGQARYVGDEKLLRLEGFEKYYRNEVKRQIEIDLDQLKSPDHAAIWIALLEYYSYSVYPLKVVVIDGISKEQKSLPTLICEQLVEEWTKRLHRMIDEDLADQILNSARTALYEWTDDVIGSIDDVYLYEINENEYKGKLVLKREVFKLDWTLGDNLTNVASSQAASKPEPSDALSYFVAVDGKASGPHGIEKLRELVDHAVLTANTRVWSEGMSDWMQAKDVKEVAGLLVQPPPLMPPPLNDGPPPVD